MRWPVGIAQTSEYQDMQVVMFQDNLEGDKANVMT